MRRHRLSTVVVYVAAKVNVGWQVGSVRPDGYHDVTGCLQTISLTDRLELSSMDGDVVEVEVPGHPSLEAADNLVHIAARSLAERTGETHGTRVVVHKSIPVAAGLGGGSADAAGALVGLNALWGAGLRPRDLADLARTIGSDVSPILTGGLVHASGRGERVRNIGSFDRGWLVLGVGAEEVSAADAYAALDAMPAQNADTIEHNDLEAAAIALVPELAQRVDAMREATRVAFVSGSGPTVIGVTAGEDEARAAAEAVHDRFADVRVAEPIPWGVRLHIGP